jgi:tetratricopeptide (TPR) repeat protein
LNELSRWIERNSTTAWAQHTTDYLMYMALQDYFREKYPEAVTKYLKVLQVDPLNTEAMKRLAYTYTAMNDKVHARALWKKLIRINPQDEDIREKLEKQ